MTDAGREPESGTPLVAGPQPYSIYRLEPTKVFGLRGMHGMFDDDRHHEPTRWRFRGD